MYEIDSLLSRCLKNWAANHPLPVDGRERLLEKAAGLHKSVNRDTHHGIDYDFRGAEHLYRNPASWLVGPLSQSPLYSFHISTIFRMAT